MPDFLQQSYEAARSVTRRHAKSFYFSSVTLPTLKRSRAYAVYAYCRHMDDVVDEAQSGQLQAALGELRGLTTRIFSGNATQTDRETYPWLEAFLDTASVCEVPESYFQDLLSGVEMDQGKVRLRTWEELDRYCYLVAGVVGLMMTRIFGLQDRKYEEQALQLGTAMQLTNILRDVKEDLDRDRIYLPAMEMEAYGISESDLLAGRYPEGWRTFMEFQVQRAREFYHNAEYGIRALPDDGSRKTVWLMRRIYAGILDEIEKAEFRVMEGRVYVGFARKCAIALRVICG